MDNSVLFAKFMGPFIVVIGAGLLLNRKAFQEIMEGFTEDKALIFISGLMTFIIGLAMVIFHNMWITDWRLIITVFGWLTLIKGVILIVFPDRVIRMTDMYKKHIRMIMIPWSIMIVFGIFLMMKGYL
jgi:hypothetical protein